MTGISGIVSDTLTPYERERFLGAIAPGNSATVREIPDSRTVLAVSAPDTKAQQRRLVDGPGFTLVLAGHVVVEHKLDWNRVVEGLRRRDKSVLGEFSGRFAIACLDHREQVLYLITDRLSQYPLYVAKMGEDVAFSTSQSGFCALKQAPGINQQWFVEFFFANFSASHESFLADVTRLPAGSITRVFIRARKVVTEAYAPKYQARVSQSSPQDEVAAAKVIFAKRFPLYLGADEHGVAGLSSGFDSRAVLAYFASRPNFSLYTYGVPGCEDAIAAAALSRELQLKHASIPFAEEFERELPELLLRTVWLSAGLQSCLRATLTYVYRNVRASYPQADAILSGDSGDQLLRGHGNVPSIVSRPLDHLFRTGEFPPDLQQDCDAVFADADMAFTAMSSLKANLMERYGDLRSSAAHIGYLAYETPAEYFAGEASIADQYVDFRTPFCDRDVVEFAFSSALSTLTFSRFGRRGKDNLAKNFLTANLVSTHDRLSEWPIHGRSLQVFAQRKRAHYIASAVRTRILRVLAPKRMRVDPPLEDWPRWFGIAWPMISRLLTRDSRVEGMVKRSFIDRTLANGDIFWINKLLTSEVVLRLRENAWNLDTLLRDAGIGERQHMNARTRI